VCLAAFGDGTTRLGCLDGSRWWCARGVLPLNMASNGQGLRVRELDVDVLLLQAGKLTVELIGVRRFLHIELWLEASECRLLWADRAVVGIEVVEETEERGEG